MQFLQNRSRGSFWRRIESRSFRVCQRLEVHGHPVASTWFSQTTTSTMARARSLFVSVASHVHFYPSSLFRRTRLATRHCSELAHRLFVARWSLTVYSRSLETWRHERV